MELQCAGQQSCMEFLNLAVADRNLDENCFWPDGSMRDRFGLNAPILISVSGIGTNYGNEYLKLVSNVATPIPVLRCIYENVNFVFVLQ